MKKQIFTKGKIKIGILFFAILLMVAGFSYLQNINSTQAQGGGCVGGATDPNCWSTVSPTQLTWGPQGVTTGVSTDRTLSNGKANTAILRGLSTTAYPAANYCYNLTEGGVSAGTWYLPSAAELLAGWNSFGINGFPNHSDYLSSTEEIRHTQDQILFLSVGTGGLQVGEGGIYPLFKSWSSGPVRCLRDGLPLVTFDSQSATVPASPTAKRIVSPATTVVTLPTAPTKTGYTFGGWYTAENGGGTAFTATTPVTANITVYAKWMSDPTSKGITSFSFSNPSYKGVIDEKKKLILVDISNNVDITKLTPTIEVAPGATVSPVSGKPHNFSGLQKYTVTASDGSTQDYNVVLVGKETIGKITSFSLTNPVTGKIKGVVDAKNNTIQFNYNLELNNDSFDFVPDIEIHKGATISPASGVTQNFFNPTKYTVTAKDGVSKTEYNIIFNNPKKSGKNIQSIRYSLHPMPSYGIPSPSGVFVGSAMIDQSLKEITYHIPFGSPNSYVVNPKSGRIVSDSDSQVFVTGTGYNPADYNNPVDSYPENYTVKAQNGSIQYYNVNLIIGAPVASPGQYCGSSACGSQSAQVIQAGISGVQSIETIQVGPYRQLTSGNARVVSCPANTNYDVCVENQNDGLYNYVLLGVKLQTSSSIKFSISSSTINFGKSVVLTWEPSNMTSCTASGGSAGWEGNKDPSDGIHTWTSNGLTTGTYTYNISCITPSIAGIPGKTVSSNAVVVVSPIIYSVDFFVSSSTIMSGNTVILSWTPSNMTSCIAGGGRSGILTTGTYTYNISCTNGTKTIPKTVTVSVVPFAGGEGTLVNPYKISNWEQLNSVRNYLDKSFILTANLSSTTVGYSGIGNNWQPIGSCGPNLACWGGADYSYLFRGNFNGNNKTISNLTINLPSTRSVGFFGGSSGSISNLGLVNVSVTGTMVGGLVGFLGGGSISNSYSIGSVASNGPGYTGGLVGLQRFGTITRSYSSGSVSITGGNFAGGLVGTSYYGSITHSYSNANVSTCCSISKSAFGGLVGSLEGGRDGGIINNSYATGNVDAIGYSVGGLVGLKYDGGRIENSYSTGRVSGTRDVGGLVGTAGGAATNSYWDNQTSGQTTSPSGTGLSTEQMKTPSTFATWDTSKWNFVEGFYPALK
ncbi:MAG: DUF5018 domain-containing protein [Candidatus Taylorbacteria bacterium]|nr:DUF5018 domain-containing protein [Candidatus Taylorbacteria bacterium]